MASSEITLSSLATEKEEVEKIVSRFFGWKNLSDTQEQDYAYLIRKIREYNDYLTEIITRGE